MVNDDVARRMRTGKIVGWYSVCLLGIIVALYIAFTLGKGTVVASTYAMTVSTARLQSVVTALELFERSTGRYPTSNEGIAVLGSTQYRGPYVPAEELVDGWGHPFLYDVGSDGTPSVSALGADGLIGGVFENADVLMRPRAVKVTRSANPSAPSQP